MTTTKTPHCGIRGCEWHIHACDNHRSIIAGSFDANRAADIAADCADCTLEVHA